MKKMMNKAGSGRQARLSSTLYVIAMLALCCAGLNAQTTNIVVTVVTPPAQPTLHNIKIPAATAATLNAVLLPQIDPQCASVTGKSATSISLRKNPDGTWSGTVVFQ